MPHTRKKEIGSNAVSISSYSENLFAQLILVAHAAHGVSVKIFNWEEFFLLNMCNFVHIVLFHTQCVILHTHCVILHTV